MQWKWKTGKLTGNIKLLKSILYKCPFLQIKQNQDIKTKWTKVNKKLIYTKGVTIELLEMMSLTSQTQVCTTLRYQLMLMKR